MHATIVLLPGDGIGPEIVAQGKRVLEVIAKRFGHTFDMPEHAIGGNAIERLQKIERCSAGCSGRTEVG
jgi:3-isopropylmalate dehydrogenase